MGTLKFHDWLIVKMSLFDNIKDVTYINSFKQFLHGGSNNIFIASILNINTLNKDCAWRWVVTDRSCTLVGLQLCASATTNPTSVNDYYVVINRGGIGRIWFIQFWSRRDRDDFGWRLSRVGLIACNLFRVQLFQNCCHFTEISIVTQE